MIAVLDYGMGNLASVYNAFKKVGAGDVQITSDPAVVKSADKVVLPGVGAFEDAIRNLEKFHLIQPIKDFIQSGKPFMGICLGMHLLFEKGYENGVFDGLGVLKGEVIRFKIDLPVPHIGWNQVKISKNVTLFDNLADNAYFYFDHSFFPVPVNAESVAMKTVYGIEYASGIVENNVVALQFHPEKSHMNGLKIIKSFSAMH